MAAQKQPRITSLSLFLIASWSIATGISSSLPIDSAHRLFEGFGIAGPVGPGCCSTLEGNQRISGVEFARPDLLRQIFDLKMQCIYLTRHVLRIIDDECKVKLASGSFAAEIKILCIDVNMFIR
jgi:hypothetical protein